MSSVPSAIAPGTALLPGLFGPTGSGALVTSEGESGSAVPSASSDPLMFSNILAQAQSSPSATKQPGIVSISEDPDSVSENPLAGLTDAQLSTVLNVNVGTGEVKEVAGPTMGLNDALALQSPPDSERTSLLVAVSSRKETAVRKATGIAAPLPIASRISASSSTTSAISTTAPGTEAVAVGDNDADSKEAVAEPVVPVLPGTLQPEQNAPAEQAPVEETRGEIQQQPKPLLAPRQSSVSSPESDLHREFGLPAGSRFRQPPTNQPQSFSRDIPTPAERISTAPESQPSRPQPSSPVLSTGQATEQATQLPIQTRAQASDLVQPVAVENSLSADSNFSDLAVRNSDSASQSASEAGQFPSNHQPVMKAGNETEVDKQRIAPSLPSENPSGLDTPTPIVESELKPGSEKLNRSGMVNDAVIAEPLASVRKSSTVSAVDSEDADSSEQQEPTEGWGKPDLSARLPDGRVRSSSRLFSKTAQSEFIPRQPEQVSSLASSFHRTKASGQQIAEMTDASPDVANQSERTLDGDLETLSQLLPRRATAATTASVNAPDARPVMDLPSQIASKTLAKAEVLETGDSSRFQMKLDPPELGSVMIDMQKTLQGTVIRVTAADPATQQLLQDAVQNLNQSESSGSNVFDNLSFDMSGGNQQQNSEDRPFPVRVKEWLGTEQTEQSAGSTETQNGDSTLDFVA